MNIHQADINIEILRWDLARNHQEGTLQSSSYLRLGPSLTRFGSLITSRKWGLLLYGLLL